MAGWVTNGAHKAAVCTVAQWEPAEDTSIMSKGPLRSLPRLQHVAAQNPVIFDWAAESGP